MQLSYLLPIILVSIVQFAAGALWYSPLMFGKKWMNIMGSNHLNKEELKKLQKSMTPFYALQLVLTVLTNTFLFLFLRFLPTPSSLYVVFIVWIAFIMPTQISSVLWGNTPKKQWLPQILIACSFQFLSLLFAGFMFSMK